MTEGQGQVAPETQAAVRRAFDRLVEIEPLYATYVGAHDHDHRLAEGGRDDIDAQADVWRSLESDVEGVRDYLQPAPQAEPGPGRFFIL